MSSFEELRQLASRADSEAQYNLAIRYQQGVEIEKSDVEAVRWLKLASGGGLRAAHFELALHLQVPTIFVVLLSHLVCWSSDSKFQI